MESLVLFQPVVLRGKKQWTDALAAVVSHNNRSLELLSRQTNTVACTYSCCAFCLSIQPGLQLLMHFTSNAERERVQTDFEGEKKTASAVCVCRITLRDVMC